MPRRNHAREDAELVLSTLGARAPRSAIDRMALIGARAVLSKLAEAADYRSRNLERLRTYARDRARVQRAAAKAEEGKSP